MSRFEDLDSAWSVWSEERHRVVLVYRPDIFDSQAFPAPCLPTIYLTKGRRNRRPGDQRPRPDDPWYATLSLEPEVTDERADFEGREQAIDGVHDIAAAFAAGEIDYRSLYQVPREAYLDKLDELTGRAED